VPASTRPGVPALRARTCHLCARAASPFVVARLQPAAALRLSSVARTCVGHPRSRLGRSRQHEPWRTRRQQPSQRVPHSPGTNGRQSVKHRAASRRRQCVQELALLQSGAIAPTMIFRITLSVVVASRHKAAAGGHLLAACSSRTAPRPVKGPLLSVSTVEGLALRNGKNRLHRWHLPLPIGCCSLAAPRRHAFGKRILGVEAWNQHKTLQMPLRPVSRYAAWLEILGPTWCRRTRRTLNGRGVLVGRPASS